jgi:hypothetical protein
MSHYIIDRFEGTDWAVLEDEQERTFLVPRRWLPANAREGDAVRETEQSPDTDTISLRLQLDQAARDEYVERMQQKRDRLPKGPPGDVKL